MTKKSQWDEHFLEEKLKELPPIKDRQSKDELFQAIQKKMNERNIEPVKPVVTKKSRPWFYPAVASAAAVFLILLIVPSLLQDGHFSTGDMDTADVERSGNDGEMGIMMDETEQAEEEFTEEAGIASMPEADDSSADEPTETSFVTVPVPFSMDIWNEGVNDGFRVAIVGLMVEEDKVGTELEDILLYGLTAMDLNGAVQFQGLQGIELNEEEKTVSLNFSEENRLESFATGETQTFWQALDELFGPYGYEKVRFYINGEPGVYVGQEGILKVEEELKTDNRGYYLYEYDDGNSYLLRSVMVNEPIDANGELFTFAETLEKMGTVSDEAWYQSAIPSTVEFSEITVEGNEAIITLSEESQLDAEQYDLLLEAVLLTATDFPIDYLTFMGGPIEEIQEFRMTVGIPVEKRVPNNR